jgi:hypothetical protein
MNETMNHCCLECYKVAITRTQFVVTAVKSPRQLRKEFIDRAKEKQN